MPNAAAHARTAKNIISLTVLITRHGLTRATFCPCANMKFTDPKLGKEVAAWYDAATSNPADPETCEAYAALNSEILVQYSRLVADGWRFEVGSYGSESAARPMLADLRNKHLFYFPSDAGELPHSLMSATENERFRCVHDVMSHGAGDYSFSWQGETAAFKHHARSIKSRLALRALATETIGQNSWMNFIGHRYADQKAILISDALLDKVLRDE